VRGLGLGSRVRRDNFCRCALHYSDMILLRLYTDFHRHMYPVTGKKSPLMPKGVLAFRCVVKL
jgi:hypothetical protein